MKLETLYAKVLALRIAVIEETLRSLQRDDRGLLHSDKPARRPRRRRNATPDGGTND